MNSKQLLPLIAITCALLCYATNAEIFPAGPHPSAGNPCTVAIDPGLGRAYVVEREFYADVAPKGAMLPTDAVSVVDLATGNVIAVVPIPNAINGQYHGIALDPLRHRVFVPNADSHNLSVIDGVNNTVITNIPFASAPGAVTIDAEHQGGGVVYVGVGYTIKLIDDVSNTIIGSADCGSYAPVYLTADPSTGLVYLLNTGKKVGVLDPQSLIVTNFTGFGLYTAYGLCGMAVSPGDKVYVASHDLGRVYGFDISHPYNPILTNSFTVGTGIGVISSIEVDAATHNLWATDPNASKVYVMSAAGANLVSCSTLSTPASIALNSASNLVCVADAFSDSLTVMDMSANFVRNIGLGSAIPGLVVSSASNRLYAVNIAADSVAVVDPISQVTLTNWNCGLDPWSIAVDDSLHQLYCLGSSNGASLTILNTTNGSVKATVNLGKGMHLAASPTTHRLFASLSSSVSVVNGTNFSVITNIPTGTTPVGIALDEANNRFYVANQHSGTISVINATTYQIITNWTPPQANVWGLALDPGTRLLYVTIPEDTIGSFNGVEILNADTGALVATVPIGTDVPLTDREAGLIAVNSRSHRAYAVDTGANTVTVIDGTNAIAVLPVGITPNDVTIDESMGCVYVGSMDGMVTSITDMVTGFLIKSCRLQNNLALLGWNSQAGATYQLQFKARWSDSWSNAGPATLAVSNTVWQTDASATGNQRFYRAVRVSGP